MNKSYLKVCGNHNVFFETYGNPKGIPVVFLHGGPGSGFSDSSKVFFDKNRCFVTFIDQRGCGNSTPNGSVFNNTTQNLTEDIELIRKHLKIESWVLFGGSWGSTLALYYASKYPEQVKSLILRGIFLGTKHEINYFVNDMGKKFFPKVYYDFIKIVPSGKNILSHYHEAVFNFEEKKTYDAIRRWQNLEEAAIKMSEEGFSSVDFKVQKISPDAKRKELNRMRVHLHYLINDCFLYQNEILESCSTLIDKSVRIIQGDLDPICPKENAFKLHNSLKNSKIEIIQNAGHNAFCPKIKSALIKTIDEELEKIS